MISRCMNPASGFRRATAVLRTISATLRPIPSRTCGQQTCTGFARSTFLMCRQTPYPKAVVLKIVIR
jgi:hypothetical protein